MRNPLNYILPIAAAVTLVACSTTHMIDDGEQLYDGVKAINIHTADSQEISDELHDEIVEAVNVRPNNCFRSPYSRHPFPLGLWIYNKWNPDSISGLKKWIYNKLADEPVLISDVKPMYRTEMIKDVLSNNGYFGSTAQFKLIDQKNPKKAKVVYDVNVSRPYLISSIEMQLGESGIEHMIDSLARADQYLQVGAKYCTDSLSDTRVRIVNVLRNQGYYYFRPDYIEYLADSVQEHGQIALRVVLANDVPEQAKHMFYIRDITTSVLRNSSNSNSSGRRPNSNSRRNRFDTIDLGKKGTLLKQNRARIKGSYMNSCISFRQGRALRVRNMNTTQQRLAQTGIFSTIGIDVTPFDSIKAGVDSVDVNVTCMLDKSIETKLEAQATTKSNSYVGPGLVMGIAHKNLFGGGEMLQTEAKASYEWQTGHADRTDFNSYEFGLSSTLSFPRLLAPSFVDRSRRYINWTRVALSGDVLNRPKFFRMVQFSSSFSYEWHSTINSLNEFTPFKLTYTKLLRKTDEFEQAMASNRAVALSFRNQFIPQMSYGYTYNKNFSKKNSISWSISGIEAGNIFAGIWRLAGKKGEKELFGTPFSQFVKGQTQLVWNHRLSGNQRIVSRAMVGAAYAYGNSKEVPYSEQFFIGGANSIRAFTSRSVGPGSYRPEVSDANGYYDQTGTFKVEMNCEYRFPIMGYFHGALFLDAGNIWLLKDDEQRPGGTLQANTFLDEIALGTGAGIRFDMGMLVVRADMGVGIHAPYDTGKSGYFNMWKKFKDCVAFHLAIGYPF